MSGNSTDRRRARQRGFHTPSARSGRPSVTASMRTRLSRWLRDHGPLTKMVIAGCRPARVSNLDRRSGR